MSGTALGTVDDFCCISFVTLGCCYFVYSLLLIFAWGVLKEK